jgi:pentatricopeptide repeat domain-containing protein 1
MRALGILQDMISFSAAISACKKGGQWQKALSLLDEKQICGIAPNAITYNAAIAACDKGAAAPFPPRTSLLFVPWFTSCAPSFSLACTRWERALALLEGMREDGLDPDVKSYNTALSACARVRADRCMTVD